MAAPTCATSGAKLFSLEPNGGGVQIAQLDSSSWREQAHMAYPSAWRVGLWDEGGHEVLWSSTNGSSSADAAVESVPPASRLFAVVDDFPFFWPMTPPVHKVDVGPEHDNEDDTAASSTSGHGRRVVELRVVSESPRVLVADGV